MTWALVRVALLCVVVFSNAVESVFSGRRLRAHPNPHLLSPSTTARARSPLPPLTPPPVNHLQLAELAPTSAGAQTRVARHVVDARGVFFAGVLLTVVDIGLTVEASVPCDE